MSALVLDAGALVALERGERKMWLQLEAAGTAEHLVWVPTTALARVWRGGSPEALLARAIRRCRLAPFDPMAHQVGELCGRAGTADICDAHVALTAARHADVVYTSDPDDIEHLLRALRDRMPTILHC